MLRTTCPLSSCQDHGLHQVIHGWDANESKWSAWAMYPLQLLTCIAKVGQFSKHLSARSWQEQTTPQVPHATGWEEGRRKGGSSGPRAQKGAQIRYVRDRHAPGAVRGSASCLPWENGMSRDKTGTGAHTMECQRWHRILVQCRLLQAHWGLHSNRERIWKIPHLMIFTLLPRTWENCPPLVRK